VTQRGVLSFRRWCEAGILVEDRVGLSPPNSLLRPKACSLFNLLDASMLLSSLIFS